MPDRNMQRPHVVILMSSYNGEKYISKQLESIANQDVDADITLFIRDDGSSDNTIREIEKWKKQIKIVWDNSSQNLKPAMSFFRLLQKAPQGDFYAFCDQDDIWYNNKLSRAIDMINCNNAMLYFCNSRMVDNTLSPINESTYSSKPRLSIPSQMICGACQGCAMVFTSECRNILLSLKIKHIIMHDLTVMLYSLAFGKVVYDDEYELDYRQHENNAESNVNKSFCSRIKQTYNRWIKNKNIGSLQAEEFYYNCNNRLNPVDLKFVDSLKEYKKHIKSKIYVLKNAANYCNNYRALRSFRMRILLNLY